MQRACLSVCRALNSIVFAGGGGPADAVLLVGGDDGIFVWQWSSLRALLDEAKSGVCEWSCCSHELCDRASTDSAGIPSLGLLVLYGQAGSGRCSRPACCVAWGTRTDSRT